MDTSPTQAPPQPLAQALHQELKCLAANLGAGLRLAFFRPMEPGQFYVNAHQLVLLLLLALGLDLAADYLTTGPGPTLDTYGLGTQALYTLLFLLSIYLIAAALRGLHHAQGLAIWHLSATPVVWLAGTVAKHLNDGESPVLGWGVFSLLVLWLLLIMARITRSLFAVRLRPALLAAGAYGLLNVGALFLVPPESLWYAADADDPWEAYRAINIEDTFYAQPERVRQALDRLEPQRPGVIDLYFVGFGSDATENVFRNEVRYVQDLFDQRFDTAGRSVALINHLEALGTTPLANTHNLAAVLRGLAKIMDTGEDILFLFLTSHGDNDLLAVDFWPLGLYDLTAQALSQALDEAGIQWRVVVLSACYSGSFIDNLSNPASLIMTAAHAERTSFGCGQESDFTYFGDAYFRQGLTQTTSFTEAFEKARALIAAREQREHIRPSLPQIALGEAINPRLVELHNRLGTPPLAGSARNAQPPVN